MNDPIPPYQVNEYAPDRSVKFDGYIADQYVLYGHRLANRGYVQSTLGGMVIRVPIRITRTASPTRNPRASRSKR